MESELYWAGRFSYGLNLLGIDSNVGLSLNSDEAQLIDVSMGNNLFTTSFEYDLSEEADGAYWARGVVYPFGGVHLLYSHCRVKMLMLLYPH